MGRYKKYQPSSSNSAVGLSMGSPRLVSRNLHFQVAKETSDGPSYANVTNSGGAFPRQSPIMGRRALGPPQQTSTAIVTPSPKLHRRQPSEVMNKEVKRPSLFLAHHQHHHHFSWQVLHAQQQSPVSNSSSNSDSSIHHQPVNLKPVTSLHQVLYQQQQQQGQDNYRINGFDMMKVCK